MSEFLTILVALALACVCIWLYKFATRKFIVKVPTNTTPPTGRRKALRDITELVATVLACIVVLVVAASVVFGSDSNRGNVPLIEAWIIVVVGIPATITLLHHRMRSK